MHYVTDFEDYELLDMSSGEKLERWKDKILMEELWTISL